MAEMAKLLVELDQRVRRLEKKFAALEGLWREFAGLLDDDDYEKSRAFALSIRTGFSELDNEG